MSKEKERKSEALYEGFNPDVYLRAVPAGTTFSQTELPMEQQRRESALSDCDED